MTLADIIHRASAHLGRLWRRRLLTGRASTATTQPEEAAASEAAEEAAAQDVPTGASAPEAVLEAAPAENSQMASVTARLPAELSPIAAPARPQSCRREFVQRRDYVAIGNVGAVVPTPLPTASAPAQAAAQADVPAEPFVVASAPMPVPPPAPSTLQVGARAPRAFPDLRPAVFSVSQYPGPEADENLDLTDDLYGYVARTINLKLRISAARQEG